MKIIDNIVSDIESSNKESFTKQEIIKLIKKQAYPILESNGIVADPNRRVISFNGTDHNVPKKVFEIIYYFISHKGKLVRRSDFMSDIWGDDIIVGERTIDVHIRKVRSLIGDDNINTHKGVGYRWVEKH